MDPSLDNLFAFRLSNSSSLGGEPGDALEERFTYFLHTSGAPVLNAAGEVVGMMLGTGLSDDGDLFCVAVSAADLREALIGTVYG